ncbi:MAG TPA: TonB-dependent receptor, partial [Gemmatimonadales bacterium]
MLAPLLAGLSLVSGATAADTLYGRILAEDGRGLPGAEISLAEARRSLVTDAEGRFVFAGLGGGTYSMAIRARGFAAETRRVEVHGKTELTVRLHPSPFQIEPIVVTAGRSPAGPLANPLSSSTLSADALRRRQSVSVAHAIERLPGIRTLSTGSQIGKPVIRGLSGPRVLALDNGIRLEDYSWSDEDGPSIDARLADRIEVVRGPQSLEYGSDALGGVVNAISADLPDAAGGPGFHRGSVELYGASNNAEVGTALRLEGAKQRIGWRIFGVGRRAASLHTPEGELDNTGYLAINGDAALALRNDHGGMEFRIAHYGGEFHLLEAGGPPPGSPPGEEAGPVRKSLDDRLQVRADRITTNWHLEARGQFQRHSLIEVSDEAGTAGGGGGETPAFDLLLNTGTLDLVAHHVSSERFPHTIGISLGAQRNSTRGPIPLVPSASIETAAGFALGEARFGKMSMMGGLRFDARHLRAEENATLGSSRETRDYGAVSGNAG